MDGATGTVRGRDLLDWWTGQLRALLKHPVRTHALLVVDPDGAAANADRPRGPYGLRLPPGSALLRRLSPVPLPVADLLSMAEMDVAAHTPLQPTDVHVVLLADAHGLPDHRRYAIVKRAVLDEALRSTRLGAVRGLAIGTPDGDVPVHRRSFEAILLPPRSARWTGSIVRATLAFAVAGGLATAAHAAWRIEGARGAVDAQLTDLRSHAAEVRRRIDSERAADERRSALTGAHMEAVPVTEVIEALTRTLPDSAHATDLMIDGEDLTVSGFARNAANLVGTLSRVDVLHDVAFASPVVRLPGEARERFAIRARIGRPGVPGRDELGRDGR